MLIILINKQQEDEMKNLNQKGFTLVELMVVVAIIGILSAVAIPNFKKYQAKSKQSEAKLQLSGIYTTETAFFAEYDVYAGCLDFMGYDPGNAGAGAGGRAGGYYALGLAAGSVAAVPSNFPGGCAANATDTYPATKGAGGTMAGAGDLPATNYDESTFTAGAAGFISNGAVVDQWDITQDKIVVNQQNGV